MAVGSIGGGGGGQQGGQQSQIKQTFQEAKTLAQGGNQQVAQDLAQIHQAHQQAQQQGAQGAQGQSDGDQGGVGGISGGGGCIASAGPSGADSSGKAQMQAEMAPLIQQLTSDVQNAQQGGGQQQQQAATMQA